MTLGVCLLYSKSFEEQCSLLPVHPNRSAVVHSLLLAFLKQMKKEDPNKTVSCLDCTIIAPSEATKKELCKFHSDDFIETIQMIDSKALFDNDVVVNDDDSEQMNDCQKVVNINQHPSVGHNKVQHQIINDTCSDGTDGGSDNDNDDEIDDEMDDDDDDDDLQIENLKKEYGLLDDAQTFKGIFKYITNVAGASLTGAKLINQNQCNIAFNWEGGRHHARKDRAAGFCYVNDTVLAIMELMKRHERILCVDIDVHHGDGIEEAFYFTNRVLTISFHQYDKGLYPGTGGMESKGMGKGKNFNINVPLKEGVSDAQYLPLFKEIISNAFKSFNPSAMVLLCGADALTGDPLGTFNLSIQAYEDMTFHVLKLIKQKDIPLMILGGGGYNIPNTARCFASVMGVVLLNYNKKLHLDDNSYSILPNAIPEHDDFTLYLPSLERYITLNFKNNQNSQEYIQQVKKNALEMMDNIQKMISR